VAEAAAADGGVVVARRDKLEVDDLRSLAQATLRHDGVRAVVLGGSPDGRQGGPSWPPRGGTPDATSFVRTLGKMVGGGGGGSAEVPRRGGRIPLTLRRRWPRRDGSCPRERRRGVRARPGPVAALDLGARRIAWRTATAGRSLASPWGTIQRSGDPARDRSAVLDAVREVEALTVVVGLPLSLSGQVGPAARSALDEAAASASCSSPSA